MLKLSSSLCPQLCPYLAPPAEPNRCPDLHKGNIHSIEASCKLRLTVPIPSSRDGARQPERKCQ